MDPFEPTVHTLRLTLRGVKPAVWRRIVVRSDTPLPKFARMLEAAMGWEGYHLHMFDVGGVLFGRRGEDSDYMIDERSAMVKHLLPQVKSKMRWDYDFGDGWEHDVAVESIESPEAGSRYPLCLDGKRSCPPENSGGAPGYQQLLRALAAPKRPRTHAHGVAGGVRPGDFRPHRREPEVAGTMRLRVFQKPAYKWNSGPLRTVVFQWAGPRRQ